MGLVLGDNIIPADGGERVNNVTKLDLYNPTIPYQQNPPTSAKIRYIFKWGSLQSTLTSGIVWSIHCTPSRNHSVIAFSLGMSRILLKLSQTFYFQGKNSCQPASEKGIFQDSFFLNVVEISLRYPRDEIFYIVHVSS